MMPNHAIERQSTHGMISRRYDAKNLRALVDRLVPPLELAVPLLEKRYPYVQSCAPTRKVIPLNPHHPCLREPCPREPCPREPCPREPRLREPRLQYPCLLGCDPYVRASGWLLRQTRSGAASHGDIHPETSRHVAHGLPLKCKSLASYDQT